jgi:glycosyltransferase involved in cell wall biosynthesis
MSFPVIRFDQAVRGNTSMVLAPNPNVLILTPLKGAVRHLPRYVELIERLDWPRDHLSVALLEGDSADGTYAVAEGLLPRLGRRARRAELYKRDFGFNMPAGVPRWAPAFQLMRRSVLARARNHLLFRALDDEDWVLWIDVDVIDYPPDILRELLAAMVDIVVPHCVNTPGGKTFDLNNWAAEGTVTLADARGSGLMRLDAVGGTMLLIRADVHRDGLVFPTYRYGVESPKIRKDHPLWGKGEIETEGLGAMASDMGIQCWGMPDIEIIHADE